MQAFLIANFLLIYAHVPGTHITGTAAGTKYGVAKDASIHPVRVLGSDGSGAWSGIIKGLNWIAKPYIPKNPVNTPVLDLDLICIYANC